MHYDIASKVIISHCKEPFLSYFCGLSVKNAELIEERPEETPSLRRSDFIFKVTLQNDSELLVLVEFVTYWQKLIPLRTLEYRCRHILKEKLPVKTYVFLFKPSREATEFYKDEEVEFRFNLVRIYEISAKEFLEKGPLCLLPFLPLMKEGEKFVEEADKRIYEAEISRSVKSELLTGLAIFSGLISKEIALNLIKKRRDIMIESHAYEIIKKEGFEEGLKVGLLKGKEEGLKEGFFKGKKEGLKEGLLKGKEEGLKEGLLKGKEEGLKEGERKGLLEGIEALLELKFGFEGLKLFPKIAEISHLPTLKTLKEIIKSAKTLSEVEKFIEEIFE